MVNVEQVKRDEPQRLVGGHPVERIEASEIHRTGKRPQRALAAQIEISVEIAQRQLAKSAVDRFAIAAASVVGLGDGSPVTLHAINGDHMVGIVFRFQIQN